MPRVPAFLVLVAGLVIFLANAGSLVLQLLAGRYLAPFIGSSVETWTSVIGVFLTGIALGNFVGGRIADRYPSTRTLAVMLLLGAVCSLSLMAGMQICKATGIHRAIPLEPRIPVLAFAFCLAPAFALSLITPLTIKLMLSDVKNAGRISGLIFGLGTLGCLLGNYLTGFYFMAEYPLDTISCGVSASLAALGLPIALIGYRAPKVEAVPTAAERTAGEGFFNRPGRGYAVVFIASFCGMSLELTGARYLAPILGVSLYSWTGIIGVMLAGTALGNLTGGIAADRGPLLTGAIRGLIRFRILNLVVLCLAGSFLGAAVGPLMAKRLQMVMRFGDQDPATLRLAGAIVGATLTTMLLLPSQEERGRLLQVGIPRTPVLSATLLLAGMATICILATTAILQQTEWIEGHFEMGPEGKEWIEEYPLTLLDRIVGRDLIAKILSWTFALFFLPMFLLGTVSPQVIRLSVPDVSHAGRVAGSIYAVSTAGAIAGTFATGYFLIAAVGTWKMLLIIALALTVLAAGLGRLWRNSALLFGGSVVAGAAFFGMLLISQQRNKYDLETRYYAIRVDPDRKTDYGENRVAVLMLDLLQHSFVDVNDPSFLGYTHEEMQAELLLLARARRGPGTRCLVIGGGGYTLPRWVDLMLPDVKTDVVEIDPGVTRVAYEMLGLSGRHVEVGWTLGGPGAILAKRVNMRRPSNIATYSMDGRQYVDAVAAKGSYDLVMQDAVNDLSVPYHLLTEEYNDGIKQILAPDGVYLLTLIDSVRDGVLWRSAVATMRKTFPNVQVIYPSPFPDRASKLSEGRHVLIVYGADKPLDFDRLHAVLLRHDRARAGSRAALGVGGAAWPSYTHAMPDDVLDEALQMRNPELPFDGRPILLTDQYAPVDNLMSGVFKKR